ncbi:MAG: YeeE/YedE family protein [Burkholderiaceae bacterium]|jgi:uncharacterized membrane protein YedE/YeeE|nr:YeeE/YedE family protein [Burkholderiaceae bacterium]
MDAAWLLLVAAVGFAAHRASLCNVRAVAELLQHRSAHLLGAFLGAALWATLVAGVLTLGDLHGARLAPAPRLGWLGSLCGAFVFGAGAAVNGGCSMSTLQRLADGEWAMALSLIGFVIGAATVQLASMPLLLAVAMPADPAPWPGWSSSTYGVLVPLGLWGIVETRRLVTGRAAGGLRTAWLQPAWKPRSAAAVMGIAGGLLYAVPGVWTYTNLLRAEAAAVFDGRHAPALHVTLALALFAGMALSSWQRGSFAPRRSWRVSSSLRHALGGLLMGAGGALVPGGNDTVLLSALPGLSVVAVGAYLAMLAGIASTLWAMTRLGLPTPAVPCASDRCADVATDAPGRR